MKRFIHLAVAISVLVPSGQGYTQDDIGPLRTVPILKVDECVQPNVYIGPLRTVPIPKVDEYVQPNVQIPLCLIAIISLYIVLLITQYAWQSFKRDREKANKDAVSSAIESDNFDVICKYAEAGNAVAQAKLGGLYNTGHGVPQDCKEAAIWFRKAADQGYVLAQNSLGAMYATGRGVTQDLQEAANWCRKAAEQGDAMSQNNLGAMYKTGHGVPQDHEEAVLWFRKSAEQEHTQAQCDLGVMYAIGKGVPQDYVQAHMWLNLAASQGHKEAIKNRDIVSKLMSVEQVAQAQAMARNRGPTN